MPTVTCPSCGEKGKIPPSLIGTRIKCRKCSTAFLVGPAAQRIEAAVPAAAVATPAATSHGDDTIQVDGLDDSAWASTASPASAAMVAAAAAVAHVEHDHDHDHTTTAFDAHHEPGGHKHYKLITPKDKYFEGKFELDKLEEYLNVLARQGWVVRGMATPHVNIFGTEKEQLVILLER